MMSRSCRSIGAVLLSAAVLVGIGTEADARRGRIRWKPSFPSVSRASDARACADVLKDVEQGILACSRLSNSTRPELRVAALLRRAEGHTALQKNDEAIKDYDEAIRTVELFRLQPDGMIHQARAWLYLKTDSYAQALADYDTAIQLNPNSAPFYVDRGFAYLKRGNGDAALQDLNKALDLDSRQATAYYHRAAVFHMRGKVERAIRDLNEAIKIDAKYLQAYIRRGDYFLELKENDNALREYNEAISINPRAAPSYRKRAQLHIAQANYADAIKDFSEAIFQDPKNADSYVGRAFAYDKRDDTEAARRDYDEAIVLDPDNRRALDGRSIIFAKRGDYTRAYDDAKRSLELDTRQSTVPGGQTIAVSEYQAAISLGNNLRDGKQFQLCINVLSRGILTIAKLPQQPEHADIFYARARCHAAIKRYDLAKNDLTKALEIVPEQPQALNEFGNVLLEQGGKLGDALLLMRRAVQKDPSDAYIHASIGWVLYQLKEFDEALVHLRKAADNYPADGAVQHRLGDALWMTNNRGEAFSAWERARKLTTDKSELAKLSEKTRSGLEEKPATEPPANPAPHVVPREPPPAPEPPALPQVTPASERRVALVIGNSAYENVSVLDNPSRDASAIAATLRAIGFEVVLAKTDLNYSAFIEVLRSFSKEAAKADWAMVYYAGHGIEINGANFLVPTDAKFEDAQDVQLNAVALDWVLGAVGGASKLKLVLLDACRNNPFLAQLKNGRGAAVARNIGTIDPPAGTMVAYAAKQGQVAIDGPSGKNSPFVESLVKQIQRPGLELNFVLRNVRDEVVASTRNQQEPYIYGSLPAQQFFFVPPSK